MDAHEALRSILCSALLSRWRDRYVGFAATEKNQAKFLSALHHELLDRFDRRAVVCELPGFAWSLPAYSNGDAGVVFSPGGKQIVVGESSGNLSWWDLDKKTPLFSKKAGAYIISMKASSDGSRIVTHDTNDLVQVWDSNTGRELKRIPYARWTTSAALSPGGETLASGGEEWGRGYLYIFEATTISPENPIAAACGMLSGNLTRNQWHEHFADRPYRLTCPELGEPEEL